MKLLAPLSSPRPAAGQMYLDRPADLASTSPIAAREWGSDKDKGTPRQIRGRKFYWRTKSDNGRAARHDGHADGMTNSRWVWDSGSEFEGEVLFENVTLAELGSVVAAIAPGMVLKDLPVPGRQVSDYVLPLGGAKPLGFGSASITDVTISTWGTSRYSGGSAEDTRPAKCVEAFVDAVGSVDSPFENADLVPGVWPSAERLLRLAVWGGRDNAVWYPPGVLEWNQRKGHEQEFSDGFEFWKKSAGQKGVSQVMTVLPFAVEERLLDTTTVGTKKSNEPLSTRAPAKEE